MDYNYNVTGFYHDPPVFLVEHPIDHAAAGGTWKVLFDRFDHEILRTNLAEKVQMRATVEGLFAFDFSNMTDCAISETGPELQIDFFERAEKRLLRTRIMNAYLAYFYTQQILIENVARPRMVVTPELTITMDGFGHQPSQGFGNQRVSHLATSSFEMTYPSHIPHHMDSRINMRGLPISAQVAEAAAADLSMLIEQHGVDGVMLVDLYLRASKAFQDYNHSLSVITYWTIIERLVNDLWKQMQHDHASRDNDIFIDGTRRKRLADGRTYTASVMTEMLSFLDYISKDIYDDVSAVRKCRNDWTHDLKPVDADVSMLANSVCERLLNEVKDLTLKGATGLSMHGG